MSPNKQVSTLQTLTFSASSALALASCERIEDMFQTPDDEDLPFDTPEYRNSVRTLRQHLQRFVAPIIWQSFFESVSERAKRNTTLDEITVYSVFVFDTVYLEKFSMPDVPQDIETLFPKRYGFWKECAAMLPYLVELDLTYVDCGEVIEAFSRSCKMLEVIVLPQDPRSALLQVVINNWQRLRKITWKFSYSYPPVTDDVDMLKRVLTTLKHLEQLDYRISGNVLQSLDIGRKLQLRKLNLDLTKSEEMAAVADLCPHLTDLRIGIADVQNKTETCRAVLHNLASNSLKLTKLRIFDFRFPTDVLDEFVMPKGSHLTDLTINFTKMTGTTQSFLAILSKCRNLSSFCMEFPSGLTAGDAVTPPISFPKLNQLNIYIQNDATIGLSFVDTIIANTDNLQVFTLSIDIDDNLNDELLDIEEPLVGLFTNQGLRNVTKVTLSCGYVVKELTARVVRQVIETCSEMKYLEMSSLSYAAKIYVKKLRRAQKYKNVDFTMKLW